METSPSPTNKVLATREERGETRDEAISICCCEPLSIHLPSSRQGIISTNTTRGMEQPLEMELASPSEEAKKPQKKVSTESVPKIAKIQLVSSHPEVYEPCDDSFLLVDALLADRLNLINQNPKFCLEIGCGSGYVITSLALILRQYYPSTQFFATDINLHAVQTTLQTSANHGIHCEVVATDIASCLQKRLRKSIDVLVVNPPYVPTPEDEVGAVGIVSSWAGGFNGRMVINRILDVVDELLSANGLTYMVALSENDPSEICQIMREKGFGSRIALQRSTEEERLCVIKFWRERETNEVDREIADNGSSLNGWLGIVPFVNSLWKKGNETSNS